MSGSGCILSKSDNLKYFPIDCMSCEKMTKNFSQVSDFIHLKLEDAIIVIDEGRNEMLFVHVINFTESFS